MGKALTKEEITRRWRKAHMPGRLYWKWGNRRWRDWDTDEIARCIDGVVTIHFYSLEAIADEINES